MFVPKSRQKTIFDLAFDLPEQMHQSMKETWAEAFQQFARLNRQKTYFALKGTDLGAFLSTV